MAKQKKPVHRVQMTEGKRIIILFISYWKNTIFRQLKISRRHLKIFLVEPSRK